VGRGLDGKGGVKRGLKGGWRSGRRGKGVWDRIEIWHKGYGNGGDGFSLQGVLSWGLLAP